ncbi:MAG TPA: PEP-CTERM sorting domain-containing protein [Candidatus Acidoferrales bacterium]|jgi:hypothetical protein|nr:PEP-CTERM sorting domain-containing protein [Candidatus Acidoferrales bacterium]
MKIRCRAVLLATLCVLALGVRAKADDISLTLDPSGGAVAGPAGSTVGWGFTLTDAGTDFAVVTGSDFCTGMLTSPCSNAFGVYTDFIGQQFVVVGPSPEPGSISQSFDDTSMAGVGSFAIDSTSAGTLDGYVALTYDLYSVDPNAPDFDPTVDTVSTGNYLYAPASVTVGSSLTSVPEPGTMTLLAVGMALLFFLTAFGPRRRRALSA